MAVIKMTGSKGTTGGLENYLKQEEKTEEQLISGKDCNAENFTKEFEIIKDLYDKHEGRQHIHIVQSFDPGEVSPEMAHEIGVELANSDYFKGYQVAIVTHIDREHVHNHLVVNSVSHEDGLKYQSSKADLYELRNISDKLCMERELSIVREDRERVEGKIITYNINEYKQMEKHVRGEERSWKIDTYNAIQDAKEVATDRKSFIQEMSERGYEVNWSDSRKYITFEDSEGNKIRDKNIEKSFSTDCSKEGLSRVFEMNREREIERERERLEHERQIQKEKERARTRENERSYPGR